MPIPPPLQELFWRLDAAGTGAVAALLVLCLLNCFFGYATFRVLLAVEGFLSGGFAAMTLLHLASPQTSHQWLWIAGLVGGLIGAVLSWSIYRVMFALIVGGMAAIVAAYAVSPSPDAHAWTIGAVVGVAMAIVAFLALRFIIIVLTAFGGGFWAVYLAVVLAMGGTVQAWNQFFSRRAMGVVPVLLLIGALGLSIAGATVQLRLTKPKAAATT